MITALRILPYRKSFDEVEDSCELSFTYTCERFLSFCSEVIHKFVEDYFRNRNESDLRRIISITEM